MITSIAEILDRPLHPSLFTSHYRMHHRHRGLILTI